MKKIFNLLSLLVLLFTLTACSGSEPVDTTGSISGTVYDADESDRPLKGVQVTITGHETSISKTTDEQGNYSFANIEIGEYTVKASLQDYATETATVYVSVGQQRQQDFHLRRASSSLYVVNHQLDFGVTTNQIGLDMENHGQALMKWEVIENLDWLELTPRSGEVRSGDKATITVIVNRSGKEYGDYKGTFVISTKDGGSETVNVTMSVSSGSDESLPQVSMLGVDNETDISAHFSGEIVSCGTSRVLRHGFVWDVEQNPSLEKGSAYQNLGATEEPKNFSYNPSSLTPNTTYYVRAFATNTTGTVYSRQELRFTTKGERIPPKVETGAANQVTSTTAVLNGNLLEIGNEIGVTQHGHIWSSTQNIPTLDNTSSAEQTRKGELKQTTSFTSAVTGLKPGTKNYYRAYAVNAQGRGYGDVHEFTTPVGAVTLTTNSVTSIIHNEATGGGHIIDLAGNQVTEYGLCWGLSEDPNIGGKHQAADNGITDWTVRMTGLTEKTTYHVRAYVSTATGNTYYGNDVLFTTSHEISLPQTSGTTVTSVGVSGATLKATLTNDGDGTISDVGFCIATHSGPSIADQKVSCGTSAQTFSKVVSGLKEGTTYYVCAYATNERGTGYGEQTTFTTQKVTLPTLSAVTVSRKSFRSATFAATVTSIGNGTLKRTGFCYATTPNPTLSNHLISCGTETTLRGSTSALTASTTYYVRAFAENEKGVAYSEQVSFTTDEQPQGSDINLNDYEDDTKW